MFLTDRTSSSFRKVTDANNIILSTGIDAANPLPEHYCFLYVGVSVVNNPNYLTDNFVWFKSSPLKEYATEHTFYSSEYDEYYSDMIKPLEYKNITGSIEYIQKIEDLDMTAITMPSQEYKVLTPSFETYEGSVNVHIAGTTSDDCEIRTQYRDSEMHWYNIPESKVNFDSSPYEYNFTFDAASMAQYSEANAYRITFVATQGTAITITEYNVTYKSNFESYELYDPDFVPMMSNVFNAISDIKNDRNLNILTSPDGNKWRLIISNNGSITTQPLIPNDVLMTGNSIMFGFSTFGMAATSSSNDYFHYVNEYLHSKNENVNVTKLYSSPFEHAEDLATGRAFIENNRSLFRNKNLVVIQIGDNVNNTAKKETFAQTFPELLDAINTESPGVRIIIVAMWFSKSDVYRMITSAANDYGAEVVDIRSLRTPETEGELGATVYLDDGTTTTVTEARKTHPGNSGMQLIADAIINKLNL